MKKRSQFVLILLLVLVLALVVVPQASAAEAATDCDDCMGWPEAFAKLLTIAVQNMALSMLKTLVGIVWFFDKAAIYVFDLVVIEGLWDELRTSLLANLSALMPDIFERLIGGGTGLLYMAIMLAGVTMTLPFINSSRLVRIDQVILWAIVMITLFVSGTAGYDLIGAFENLRLNMMEIIMIGQDNNIHAIITEPMMADEADLVLMPPFAVPEAYADEYFLPPQGYETVKIVLFEAGLTAVAEAEMETDASLEIRKEMAAPGVAIALLSAIGGYVALVFALIFAMLTTAALGLILFLMAALPMGFFEFGRMVLAGILQKYLQIVILSLGAAIFVGLLTSILGLLNTVSSLDTVLRYAAIMIPVVGIQTMFLKWSLEAMTSTKDVFRQSMQTAFGASRRPSVAQGAVQSGLRAAGTAALLAIPGAKGMVANVGLNAAAGAMSGREPGAEAPRGDVFAELNQQNGERNA
jgi:hypothetical protein